jgi:AraC-like DNA-binding protein
MSDDLLDDTHLAPDLSDRADGPALIALWGEDAADSEFRLGTREYAWHRHLRGQVFCVESGLLHVRTRHGSWLLPPNRAGWMPPGEPHQVSVSGAMSGWSVLVAPACCAALSGQPRVMAVTQVMRALVQRAASWSGQVELRGEQQRLIAVLLDEIGQAPHEPLHLPMPTDRRLLRVAQALLASPGDNRTLAQWADHAGLSPRTLGRLFRGETGSSFAQWRQQALLMHALELLARGDAVADVADALGYAGPSNFIAMFRRSFGDSPGRYFAKRGG